MEKVFIRAKEVSEALQVSDQKSYKIIRDMNKDLKSKGFLVVKGRVDKKYFYDQFYGTRM
ncbi:MAG: Transcriptional regulator [Clostridiales bacterium 38_11]|nr:MAG: Transcriptional regulator [Clostridiales bacterium 38_11]